MSYKFPLISSAPVQSAPNNKTYKSLETEKNENAKFPKLIQSCRDIELVMNLSINSRQENPLWKVIKETKEKEEVEENQEIIDKRKGIRRKSTGIDGSNTLSQIEKELKSSHSKEFYLKYETLQKEKKMEDEIVSLKKEVLLLKDKKNSLYNNVMNLAKKMYNCDLDIKVIDSDEYFADKKMNAITNNLESTTNSPQNRRNKTKAMKQKKYDLFVLKTLSMKEQGIRNEKKGEIYKEKEEYRVASKKLIQEIEEVKKAIKATKATLTEKIQTLSDHYHHILFEGIDTRQEGLVWVIKSIWNLGENVKLSYFPSFLDPVSIDYLFTVAHKNVEISALKCLIEQKKLKIQTDFIDLEKRIMGGVSLFRTSLENVSRKGTVKKPAYNQSQLTNVHHEEVKEGVTLKEMNTLLSKKDPLENIFDMPAISEIERIAAKKEGLKRDLVILKREEMKRLFKEYIENNYEMKHGVAIDTVVSALVGESNKDSELVNYSKLKKVTIKNIIFIELF